MNYMKNTFAFTFIVMLKYNDFKIFMIEIIQKKKL